MSPVEYLIDQGLYNPFWREDPYSSVLVFNGVQQVTELAAILIGGLAVVWSIRKLVKMTNKS